MCCQRANRQCTEKEPEREGEKGKVWVDFSADLDAFIWHTPAIPAPVISPDSCRPPSPFSVSLPLSVSLFLQARADYQCDSRGQHCSLGSGSISPHLQDGLYNRPPGVPASAPEQLGAGGSGPGSWWSQSTWGALLSGASVPGHWRNGEVLVPLHLSLWNHLFGHWCGRNGSDLHLQWPATDQSGLSGATCHGSFAVADGHCLLDCS